ncbi:MAG: methyltransferase [Aquirhabdus sp.]
MYIWRIIIESIQGVRARYARQIVASAGATNARLVAAFAAVAREDFLGAGPWPVCTGFGYQLTASDDPRLLYHDILIGLATDRGINNGQPSLHAQCLAVANPLEGETVVHVGAGTGYYSAVLAELVGATGIVHAYEIEPDLAARAKHYLSRWRNVSVYAQSAANIVLPPADVIYVNAGASHPLDNWLDALRIGGRLVFPLTPRVGYGCMICLTKKSETIFAANIFASVSFVGCIGARDDMSSQALAEALAMGGAMRVRSLHRDSKPDRTAWCVGRNWWLSTAEVG